MKQLLAILILFIFNGVATASPATPEVVRYDRYLLVSTSPQQPPLEQLTALSVPPGFHPTIGEALQYLLRLKSALQLLAGPAWRVITDENR